MAPALAQSRFTAPPLRVTGTSFHERSLRAARAFSLAPTRSQPLKAASPSPADTANVNLMPSLAAILRPQSIGNWLMPYMAQITPTYIEAILRGGIAGNHIQMYQLFDLMWDTSPEIQACIGEYREGVLGKKVVFEPYCADDQEPTPQALEKCSLVSAAFNAMRPDWASDENDLAGTISDLLAARFHGQTVLEIDWYDTYGTGELNIKTLPDLGNVLVPRSTYWVNPTCYAWDATGRLGLALPKENINQVTRQAQVAKQQGQLAGPPSVITTVANPPQPGRLVEFPPNKFLIGINKEKTGTPLAGSCFRALAWWWCMSNMCGDWLANYAQIFGIPLRKATYDASVGESQKAEVRQMLQSMASATWALVPKGVELDFDKATTSGGQSPQAFLHQFADSQIRKVILHQTMTGGSHDSMGKGGGKAFGSVEQDVKNDCIEAGAAYVAKVINLQFIPYILNVNYGKDGDMDAPTCKLVNERVGGLVDAQRDSALVQIMDVPDSYLRRKYGVPRLGDDDQLAGIEVGVLGAQAKVQQQQHDDQMEMGQQQAKAAQATAKAQMQQPQAGNTSSDDEQQKEDQESSKQASDVEAARKTKPTALEAAVAKTVDNSAAVALHETVEPIIARLQAIDAVKDRATKKRLLQKFLKDHSKLAEAVKHDQGLQKVITAKCLAKFVAGLKEK